MRDFGLETPWLLLAALPVAGALIALLLRTRSPLTLPRRIVGAIGLCAGSIALLLLLAGLYIQVDSERRTVWILLDRSLSVGEASERQLAAALTALSASLNPRDYIGVIGFDGEAEVLLSPQPARSIDPNLELRRLPASQETYLAAALELAAQRKVPSTAVMALVIGDGHDSSARYAGDLQRDARSAGVMLFALPVDSQPYPEVALAVFSARLVGTAKRTLVVDTVIYSTVDQKLTYTLLVNGERVELQDRGQQTSSRVSPGRNPRRFVHELSASESQLASYVVEFTVAATLDTYPRNNSLKLVVRGPGEPRALLLHGRQGPEIALARALDEIGLKVTTGGPEIMPSEAVELARYQVVILSDVPADELSPGQRRLLKRFVRFGGGLAMIGGERSFAPGGYYDTAIEEILPVTCDVTEKGRKQVQALVVALDRSGSMGAQVGGTSKMALANEGCVRTIDLLPKGSLFGILSVDTKAHWPRPFGRLNDKKQAKAAARSNSPGGGGIYIDIAVSEGLARLRGANASSKHLVIFSDGRDTERQAGVIEMVREANLRDKITVSTISLGRGEPGTRGDHWPFLRRLAAAGGGRSYLVSNPRQIPAVFSREAALSGGNYIREEEFRPLHGEPGALTRNVDFESESAPPLLGYIAVTARENAHVWLWADEDRERPLLATWHFELGKSLAFTSDARGRWANQWLDWVHYTELWQRWIRWLLPSPENISGVESEWTVNRNGPVLNLGFFDAAGNPRALIDPVAEIVHPDGSTIEVPVLPTGSGAYRVQFSRAGTGLYAATIRERTGDGSDRLAAREHQIFVPLDELLRRPADLSALRAVTAATGGRVVESVSEIADARVGGGLETVRPVSQLLWIALAGMFLALSARRFPSLFWRRTEEKRHRRKEESRVMTAAAALLRVREQLAERAGNRGRIGRFGDGHSSPTQPRPAPPPPAAPVAPVPATPQAAKPSSPSRAPGAPAANSGTLLSAMRKVRKQLRGEGDE